MFIVIDVETANPDLASICQVGIAGFRDGAPAERWESLVNPEDYFDPINVSIHGITADTVKNAPTWRDVYPVINSILKDSVVVSHTAFDRAALSRANEFAELPPFSCQWLDSARIVRRAWPELFAHSGYGLFNLAAHFNIKYREHDALEDAVCAGIVVLKAIDQTGLNIEQWLRRVEQPIAPSTYSITREGNPDGELFGASVVTSKPASCGRLKTGQRDWPETRLFYPADADSARQDLG